MAEDMLTTILSDPATIHFIPSTDEADLGNILVKNPQRTPDGFVWFLPDRKTEATVTFVGKIIYGAIGDKTGPYFSLPDKLFLQDISPTEMAKAKAGFAVRLINRDLVVDTLLSDELNDHNQAVLEFFLTVQEDADKKLDSTLSNSAGELTINVKPFLKREDGNPFYVIPVVSAPLFPQFKGAKALGVVESLWIRVSTSALC
ncbi:hypothetical protein BDM02DRAFT_3193571 [Thelephora ganbajun]|uniref:Uncharacterized protein n=1 Tax=Thelephora ganbajun TaxID=370292 RepID=A0ACB6YZG4_THEGA|nr:hypothetical protein BDM02DRAFT_3193571 [Thelephora ganbajun]